VNPSTNLKSISNRGLISDGPAVIKYGRDHFILCFGDDLKEEFVMSTGSEQAPTDHFCGTWPTVLPAAKTYANDSLKRAISTGLCTFEG
jgi:hypothetical protein